MNKSNKKLLKSLLVFCLIFIFTATPILPAFLNPLSPKEVLAACSNSGTSGQGQYARVGGVALDQAATFLANMDDITGAYYDQNLDRIVFVGKKNTTLPEFDKDDLAVAIKGVIFNKKIPAVSIEDDPSNPDGPNKKVYYYGGIENTSFGKVLFDADVKLKKYIIGYDENQQPITSSVPGYKRILQRYLDLGPNPSYTNSNSRFWITPKLITLRRDDAADSFVFDQVSMEVKTEALSPDNDPKWNQAMTEFVQHHTQYFDAFAQETPSYAQAKQLGKIVSVIKWLSDNNIASDFNWAKDYAPKIVTTPVSFPKIITPETVHNGYTYSISGGVEYFTPNTYNQDSGASAGLKTASEGVNAPKEDVHWTFTKDGQAYESVAVAADAFRSLGSYGTSETDMSFPTAGDLNLTFQRSYSSFSGGQEGVGRGWSLLPAQLVDNSPTASGWRMSLCDSNDPYFHRSKLAFLGPDGLRETFTYNCTYTPDNPVFNSKITDSITSSTRTLYHITRKDQSIYTFEELYGTDITNYNFRLVEVKDKNGNKISYNYDSSNRLANITDNKGHTITINYGSNNLISSVTDWSARTVKYTYDAQGNLLTVTDPKLGVTTYTYDANFKLTSIKDRLGKITTVNTFTPEAKLATQKDAANITNTYSYNDVAREVTTSDNLGRSEKTKYDEKARILEHADPALNSVKYTYGQEFTPLTITDKKNNKTTYTYDPNGNITSITYPDTKQVTYEYDSKNRVTRVLDNRYETPKETKYTYDTPGNLTQLNEASVLTNFTYDPTGEMLTFTDPLNKKTTWTRNSFGNKLTEKDATDKTTSFVYDTVARLTKKTDPNSKAVTYTYDKNNNLLTETTAAGKTTNSYDKEDRLIKITFPDTTTNQFTYNPSGSQVTTKDQALSTTTYGYDSYQNLTSQKDALDRTTNHVYDNLNRQTQSTTPLEKVAKWEYDANGNISKRIDENSKETTYIYDAFNRLTKITYPDLKTVTYTYDFRGNMTKMVDPVGTTTYAYDSFDRLTKVTNPYLRPITYAYDTADNLTSITYPDNRKVIYEYDFNKRVILVKDWNNTTSSYTYHANGLLATKTTPNGIVSSYTYDNANRLSAIEHKTSSTTVAKFAYERDKLGNITKSTEEGSFLNAPTPSPSPTPTSTPSATPTPSVTPTTTTSSTPTPGGAKPDLVITDIATTPASPSANTNFTTSVTVKNQGTAVVPSTSFRLVYYYGLTQPPTTSTPYITSVNIFTNSLSPGQSRVFTDSNSNFTTSGTKSIYAWVDQQNTISELNEENNIGGPKSVTITSGGKFNQFFANLGIKYLAALFNIPTANAQVTPITYVTNFTYDLLSRIKTAEYPIGVKYDFTYDKIDNRLTQNVATASGSLTVPYTYNNDNQLTNLGTESFTYDNNGNQVNKTNSQGFTNYTYNFENRLTKYAPASASATTYTYDGNNNRLAKAVGTATTRFVTDILGELPRTLAETNSSNSITKSYVYGIGLISQGTAAASSRDYYLEDGLGNIRFVTDEVGNKVRSTDYDSFGNWHAAHGQANIHMLYQGQQLDSESSLYYMRARYYDPIQGRFISKDPVKGYLTIPQTQNPYSYSLNNPTNLSDPSGESVGAVAAGALFACTLPVSGTTLAIAGVAIGTGYLLSKALPSSQVGQEVRNPKQDHRLSEGEIKKLQKAGKDVEGLKDNQSELDLFKDPKSGDIYVKPKSGAGPGEPTGLNIKDF